MHAPDPKTRDQYVAAVKVDILAMLQLERLTIFELRRISDIAQLVMNLLGATNRWEEGDAAKNILEQAEIKAPTLHKVLMDKAFDAQPLLRAKYTTMLAQEKELQHAKLNIQQASDQVRMEQVRISAQKETLILYEKQLETQREMLQLEASSKGVTLSLPALPTIKDPDEDDTENE